MPLLSSSQDVCQNQQQPSFLALPLISPGPSSCALPKPAAPPLQITGPFCQAACPRMSQRTPWSSCNACPLTTVESILLLESGFRIFFQHKIQCAHQGAQKLQLPFC